MNERAQEHQFTLRGDEDALQAIRVQLQQLNITTDEPQPSEAMADALDSPVGPEEVQAFLLFMTVVFGAGTSFFVFIKSIIDVLEKFDGEPEIVLIDPQTGQKLGTVKRGDDAEDVVRKLQK